MAKEETFAYGVEEAIKWVLEKNGMKQGDIIGIPEKKQFSAFIAGVSLGASHAVQNNILSGHSELPQGVLSNSAVPVQPDKQDEIKKQIDNKENHFGSMFHEQISVDLRALQNLLLQKDTRIKELKEALKLIDDLTDDGEITSTVFKLDKALNQIHDIVLLTLKQHQ